jgi:hypothetical protein
VLTWTFRDDGSDVLSPMLLGSGRRHLSLHLLPYRTGTRGHRIDNEPVPRPSVYAYQSCLSCEQRVTSCLSPVSLK